MIRIPTRTHGIIDYITGAALIAVPLLLSKDRKSAATLVPVAMGAGAIAYSLLTDYELGAKRKLPMIRHLCLDVANGMFLAASPWLFRFNNKSWAPYVAVGMKEIAIALFTKVTPGDAPDDEETAIA